MKESKHETETAEMNLNPVKCVKIFSEKSYLLFIFACSLLREKSQESMCAKEK